MVKLTFLGTGTSQGVPMIGCKCPVCMSCDPRDKRLRSSALVEAGERVFVIDTGPDFRYQMLREEVDRVDAVFYTHGHKDHTAGMDDLRAFNYIMGEPVNVYCRPETESVLRKDFDYAFADDYRYPGVPEIRIHTIGDEPFRAKGVDITPVLGLHCKLPVVGFRIGGLCYLTDMNYIAPQVLDSLKGVEVLVINALRRQQHISHFSLDAALAIIARVSPRRAYLTHISHQLGKYADVAPELPDGVELACDRLKVEI